LKNLHGTKKLACTGFCSIRDGKISLLPKSGKLEYRLFKSQAVLFKDLLAKEILIPSGNPMEKDEPEEGADHRAAPQTVALTQAATHWHGTRAVVDTRIGELKRAVKAHYAQGHPELLKEIDRNIVKIDAVLEKLDHRLTDSLKASAAQVGSAREGEFRKARAILGEYKRMVQADRLIAHIDQNPFGVATVWARTRHDPCSPIWSGLG